MFGFKNLKKRIEVLENQVGTLIKISRNTISFEDRQIKLNEGFIQYEDNQIKINRITSETLDLLNQINQRVKDLTARVEVLEKKLEEKNDEKPSSSNSDNCVDAMVIYGPN